MSSIATDNDVIALQRVRLRQRSGGQSASFSDPFEFSPNIGFDYSDDPVSHVDSKVLTGYSPVVAVSRGKSSADGSLDGLPPLPDQSVWARVAVPAALPPLVKPFAVGIDDASIAAKSPKKSVFEAIGALSTLDSRALRGRHIALVYSIERMVSKILALYSPGRFAQLLSRATSDEERALLVTLRRVSLTCHNVG